MSNMYEKRVYRDYFKGINLEFFDVCVYESDLRIGAVKNLYKEARESLIKYRKQIETYISLHPVFLKTLEPIEAQPGAPQIIHRMCQAANKAGVGPMAAIAGAISEMVGNDLLNYSEDIIVENGGDIFIKTTVPRKVGIFAGDSPFSNRLAVEIDPALSPVGICTSSGTVGHSISFGKADAAVVLSKDTFLADAMATAVGNMVKNEKDIESAINFASRTQGIQGAVIILGEKLGVWGDIKLTSF